MLEEYSILYKCKKCEKLFVKDKEKRIPKCLWCKNKAKHKIIGYGSYIEKGYFRTFIPKVKLYSGVYYALDIRHVWEINPRTRVVPKKKRKARVNERIEYES